MENWVKKSKQLSFYVFRDEDHQSNASLLPEVFPSYQYEGKIYNIKGQGSLPLEEIGHFKNLSQETFFYEKKFLF